MAASSGRPDGAARFRLLILTPDLADNSTGRAYVLWLLARAEGWDVTVIGAEGSSLWPPLDGTEFAAACMALALDDEGQRVAAHIAAAADLMIAVKPLRASFGRALTLRRRTGTPLLLDIDDPDIESRLGLWNPFAMAAKSVLRAGRFWSALRLWPEIYRVPRMVSNPVLQRRFGGAIVPHARPDSGEGAPHGATDIGVVFVGTNRKHKGVDVLRRAVATLSHRGYHLTVTADPPPDAKPWERWVGTTSLDRGLDLVKHGDVVVIASDHRSRVSKAQLPAKVVDAMMAGRAVVISNTEPLVWATHGAAVTLASSSTTELAEALAQLADPRRRAEMGRAARARALQVFSVDAVRTPFRESCERATGHRGVGRRGSRR